MTHQAALLEAAQSDFTQPTQVPVFSVSKAPYIQFFVETEIDLPIYPPYTKASYEYFDAPCLRGIAGIEQCKETGNYIVTADSDFSESEVYAILRYFSHHDYE